MPPDVLGKANSAALWVFDIGLTAFPLLVGFLNDVGGYHWAVGLYIVTASIAVCLAFLTKFLDWKSGGVLDKRN